MYNAANGLIIDAQHNTIPQTPIHVGVLFLIAKIRPIKENTKPITPNTILTKIAIIKILATWSLLCDALINADHIIMNTVSDKPKPIQEITDVGLLTGGGSCIGKVFMVIITKVLNNETNYKSTKSIRGTAQCRPPEVVSAYQYLWSCHCHNREFLAQLLYFISYISTNHRFAILKSDFIIAKILFFLLSKGLGLRFHKIIKKIGGTAQCRPPPEVVSVYQYLWSVRSSAGVIGLASILCHTYHI